MQQLSRVGLYPVMTEKKITFQIIQLKTLNSALYFSYKINLSLVNIIFKLIRKIIRNNS